MGEWEAERGENYCQWSWEGPGEFYNENGQLILKGTYKNDNLDGLCEFYNDDGKLIRKCRYKNGDFISKIINE